MSVSLVELRRKFYLAPQICGAVIVGIEVVAPTMRDKNARLLLTLAYFVAFFRLAYHLTRPFDEYIHAITAWRYQEATPSIVQASKLYVSSLCRLARWFAYVTMGLIGGIALDVLDVWPQFHWLAGFSTFYVGIKWISMILFALFPVVFGAWISEVLQRRRMLMESSEVTGFTPKSMEDLGAPPTPARPPVEVLSTPLGFRAGGMDWSWHDFYKNSVVFGQSGSGKTICVLNALLDGLLASSGASGQPASGLILDPKGDFLHKIDKVCAKYGREKDLLILDPSKKKGDTITWNPLDCDDDELEVAARLAAVMESLGMKAGDNSFWVDSAKKFTRHALALVRLSNRPDEPANFAQIYELAGSWKRLASRAEDIRDQQDHRALTCTSFFVNEWMNLARETASSIQAQLTNMLDPFLMEPYCTYLAGKSTMRIAEMVDKGKILYVYMPIADKEAMSRMVSTFVKLEFFREVLKRPDKQRPSFFLCDEFQSFFTTAQGKGDADFFERSRQSNHANVIATQNFPALLKVAIREELVTNLLGNCAVKVFLRNTDDRTNEYGSKIFGEQLIMMGGGSYGQGGSKHGVAGAGASASTQYDRVVRPEEFVRLDIPDRVLGTTHADAILHLGSRGAAATKMKPRFKIHPIV